MPGQPVRKTAWAMRTVLWALGALLLMSLTTAAGARGPTASPLGALPERPDIYDAEMWRKTPGGIKGRVSIPDDKAAQLVQFDGEAWRQFHTRALPRNGALAIGGMLALIAAFYVARGRIRIERGWAGRSLLRFGAWERFCHWLLALSFLALALTGLNVVYGRYTLLPLLGAEQFASLLQAGKWLHNSIGFTFMIALLVTAITWIPQNLGGWRDIIWLVKGGGLFVRGSHPPAWKFNAGQKILFWSVMLCGALLSLSGIALLLPFQLPLFAKTFALLNMAGYRLPTELSPVQEMQYAATWHGIIALALITLVIAHIYIGTLGMQGAFVAMGSGQVDVNWAKEHHSLWADQELALMERLADAAGQAAPGPSDHEAGKAGETGQRGS
jgi:formate dehydrogenase subunit gamma